MILWNFFIDSQSPKPELEFLKVLKDNKESYPDLQYQDEFRKLVLPKNAEIKEIFLNHLLGRSEEKRPLPDYLEPVLTYLKNITGNAMLHITDAPLLQFLTRSLVFV